MNAVVKSSEGQIVEHEPTLPAAANPMQMIDRALSSGATPETLEKLMALQERWQAAQDKRAFDQAIAAAKAEIPPIVKNREVDFRTSKGRTHYKHEDLAGIARVVDPILSVHGLSYRYRTQQDGQTVKVSCILSHRDGYSEETSLSTATDQSGNKNHIQAVGSAVTYLQRYTLKLALGLAAAHDDDSRRSGDEAEAETISESQYRELAEELERLGRSEAKFAQYLRVEILEELPASRFDEAKRILAQAAAKGAS